MGRQNDKSKDWTGMDFASRNGAVENRQDEKGLLRSNLWCPNDIARLCDRKE